MKRYIRLVSILLISVFLCSSAYAAYKPETLKTQTATSTSGLIKRGTGLVFKVEFIATANNGSFALYDATGGDGFLEANVKTEGSEATSGNGKPYNFSDQPLHFTNGIYLIINNGTVVIHYE